jgi:hypothetical protein
MGEPVEYHHDLQSYFWLTYLITCNCAGPFNMRRDWNQEMARDRAGRPITPALITYLAEIKTQGNWEQVVEDHALDSKDRSANPGAPAVITCNCAGPFNMRRDWNQEIARDPAGRPITPALITNLAEIKTQGGDWK